MVEPDRLVVSRAPPCHSQRADWKVLWPVRRRQLGGARDTKIVAHENPRIDAEAMLCLLVLVAKGYMYDDPSRQR